ncbi:MAG: hypothetical protein Q7S92_03515 [Candidatus Diapherotrites archaeon]|nr:hypothetical protein [Candidatus Diapherotrites archaeon]
MNKTKILLGIALVLIAVNAFFFSFALLNKPNYAFTSEVNGVLLVSNTGNPFDLLKTFSETYSINLAPLYLPSDKSVENSVLLNNSVMPFVVVLNANDKNAVLVTLNNAVDSTNFSDCYTNFGDVNTSELLAKEVCQSLLANSNSKTIYFPHPDPNVSKPMAVIELNQITIKVSRYTDFPLVSLTVLRQLYKNTDDAIGRTNTLAAIYTQ